MKATTVVAIAAGAIAVLCGGEAAAQGFEGDVPPSHLRAPLRAPGNALELGVNVGYTQGFGDIGGGRRLRDESGPGSGVGVKLGYRALPTLGLSLTSSYEQYMAVGRERRGADVRGATLGAEASFHLAPFERIDPVISLGGGYRALWTDAPGARSDSITQGLELARLTAVLDVRMGESVALGPSLSGGLNAFFWESADRTGRVREIPDPHINSFLFAGLEGRFDLGGVRVRKLIAVQVPAATVRARPLPRRTGPPRPRSGISSTPAPPTDLNAGGRVSPTDLNAGGAAHPTDLNAGGAAHPIDLNAGGAAHPTDLNAGGAAHPTDLSAGGRVHAAGAGGRAGAPTEVP